VSGLIPISTLKLIYPLDELVELRREIKETLITRSGQVIEFGFPGVDLDNDDDPWKERIPSCVATKFGRLTAVALAAGTLRITAKNVDYVPLYEYLANIRNAIDHLREEELTCTTPHAPHGYCASPKSELWDRIARGISKHLPVACSTCFLSGSEFMGDSVNQCRAHPSE
jgi:hypothetical protein